MFEEPHLRPRAANFQPLTLAGFLTRAAEAHPQRTAVIWRDLRWDYAGLHAMAVRMADALREAGIGRGDVVSVIARNRPEMLAVHFAVPAIGAVLNTLNIRLDAGARGHILVHSESRLLLCAPACAGEAAEAFRRGRLAGFKVPRHVRFGALPKMATGKIQKFLLRQRLRDEPA